jgi:hypothetical protein
MLRVCIIECGRLLIDAKAALPHGARDDLAAVGEVLRDAAGFRSFALIRRIAATNSPLVSLQLQRQFTDPPKCPQLDFGDPNFKVDVVGLACVSGKRFVGDVLPFAHGDVSRFSGDQSGDCELAGSSNFDVFIAPVHARGSQSNKQFLGIQLPRRLLLFHEREQPKPLLVMCFESRPDFPFKYSG